MAEMARLRGIAQPADRTRLASGPGRLAEAFAITRERDNAKDLTDPRADLYIADDGAPAPRLLITRRIGITKARDMPLRYIVAESPFVSGARAPKG
jgi:DNA-3-methyladenine glycosylase